MGASRLQLSLVLLLLAVTACRAFRPEGPSLRPSDLPAADGGAAEALGPGDVLDIRIFQEPDLSGTWRIAADGEIDYPLCGKVTLGGLSTGAAAHALAECLSRGFVKSPQVNVQVREYHSRKVYVFGEVVQPGTFPFRDNMNIIQAITLAGGFNKVAARNQVNVTRLVDGEEKKVRVPVEDIGRGTERNFYLQPGDIVFVPESMF
ncbi:MAG: polysaccharide biosynthesis/export family protein [Deltaproteobacteria bacterium]|nr:polysaccharide biosynthesis/export family protein [Deltaproteobacteria bacterium]